MTERFHQTPLIEFAAIQMTDKSTTQRSLYSGHVQGVGFRWTVEKFASRLPVTGFVRNLRDGRVELVASGTAESLGSLHAAIREHFASIITSGDSERVDNPENWEDFRIRR